MRIENRNRPQEMISTTNLERIEKLITTVCGAYAAYHYPVATGVGAVLGACDWVKEMQEGTRIHTFADETRRDLALKSSCIALVSAFMTRHSLLLPPPLSAACAGFFGAYNVFDAFAPPVF